jgi:hypothetical protein
MRMHSDVAARVAVEIDEIGLHDAAVERERLDPERSCARRIARGSRAAATMRALRARRPRRSSRLGLAPHLADRERAHALGSRRCSATSARARAAAGRPARR